MSYNFGGGGLGGAGGFQTGGFQQKQQARERIDLNAISWNFLFNDYAIILILL